ncbi:autotransporter outer membrane beta-barrel domain-containing protein [Pseudomonas sp. FW215-R2]|uniref:autotransporter serine peptidase EprS n=1 Tax=unclassified Pseudomonas TaxID=196821 RepID=UPI000C88CA00|nr:MULTISPECIES: autotransporter serine protease [unclassified Pseudomonas]PMX03206.1 autotransporter outer membrane beta-barrel domain-containing protein [Pseudomonas sp. FW215-R2]PMX11829.1 autotransporter outer membrane beta-barrel domain-containing protein [Pseudomonas sp. FW215-L1]PMX25498.1 autotransporter outer membrane beta-barrel domain-containing protein [Pseudomonas sp. FW215-E1]PNA32500.1 autotransporter outer membrane beta-barrel domain-containing protein [Pseudomonas sp. FW215-R4]
MDVRFKPASVGTLLLVIFINPAQAQYVDSGKPGDPASWRSAEFLRDWGLDRMQADQAYAAGITGKGVKIGALDSGFDAAHPEFASDRYHPVSASGSYVDGSLFTVNGTLNPNNDSHGTHVVGTMGAFRDGSGMHGVAFNAQIYVGNTNKNDSFLFGPNPDPRYFKAVYDALADAGVRAINNSWGSQPPDVSYRTLADLHAAYAQHWNKGTWLDAAADVSRRGVINVFSAGNSGYPNASVRSALPYFQPDLEGHWLAVSGLDQSNQQKYNQCGIAKYWCITTPGAKIDSTIPDGGYAIKSGTSMAAPHATGALALVMERYPYMNNQQALEVLLTTATQLDGSVTSAPTERVGWGVANLKRAMGGPGQLLGAFDANLATGQRDVWSNDISDKALIQRQSEDLAEHSAWQQTLQSKGWQNGISAGASQQDQTDYAVGMARDAAAANRVYQGSLIKSGAGQLILTGDSTYRGPTTVNGGLLSVNGSLTSAVTVNDGGTLGGSGRIGALIANSGSRVAPGNSIGTLNVAGDVTFAPGSTYAVELSPNASDRIVASGTASISGATVSLSLENSPTLLSTAEAKSLLGHQYDILQAAGGIQGQFGAVVPDYLFIGGSLAYSGNGIALNVERNARSFASVGQTPNQRAVASAVEGMGAGNSVYESLLLSATASDAQQAFQQLSGEIYPALGSVLINDSRQLRDAIGERLHDANAAQSNGWIKALGAWGTTDSQHDTAGYSTSIGGLLAGVDGALDEQTRIGLVTGYSDSSLSMGSGTHSSAKVDSYHLGTYAGHNIGDWRLSTGAAYSWHRADVKRDLQYGDVSAKQKAKVDAATTQVFGEAAYRLNLQPLALEPFANLAYVHLDSDGFTEKGDAAALKSSGDQRDAVLSTLGVRAIKTINLSGTQKLDVSGHLGWQHSLTDIEAEQHLRFASGSAPYSVESTPLVRDAALVGVQASLAVTRDVRINLDYTGQLANREKSHGVGLSLNWQF